MRAYVAHWKKQVWATEGCAGIGGHVAERLTKAGENVADPPPKLSARARVFISGQGRATGATDAHSVALVGVRMAGLGAFVGDEQTRSAAGLGRPATLGTQALTARTARTLRVRPAATSGRSASDPRQSRASVAALNAATSVCSPVVLRARSSESSPHLPRRGRDRGVAGRPGLVPEGAP